MAQTQQTEQASREGRPTWERNKNGFLELNIGVGGYITAGKGREIVPTISDREVVGHLGKDNQIYISFSNSYSVENIVFIYRFKKNLDEAGIPYRIEQPIARIWAAQTLRQRAEALNQIADELEKPQDA